MSIKSKAAGAFSSRHTGTTAPIAQLATISPDRPEKEKRVDLTMSFSIYEKLCREAQLAGLSKSAYIRHLIVSARGAGHDYR